MADETTAPSVTNPSWIDQRLDRIDEALLGVLPRQERLAVIAGLETRLLKLVAENPELEKSVATSLESPNVVACRTEVQGEAKRASSAKQRRSRLAFSSGVMGIVAFVLMILSPVIYVLASVMEGIMDGAGEIGAVVLLVGFVFALSLGGLGAILLGIVSLVKISRSRNQLVGGGWAVTGLCTGALPMFAGMLGMLMLAPLVAEFASDSMASSPVYAVQVSANACPTNGYYPTPVSGSNAASPYGNACAPAAVCTAPVSQYAAPAAACAPAAQCTVPMSVPAPLSAPTAGLPVLVLPLDPSTVPLGIDVSEPKGKEAAELSPSIPTTPTSEPKLGEQSSDVPPVKEVPPAIEPLKSDAAN